MERVLRSRFADYDQLVRLTERKTLLKAELARREEMANSLRQKMGTLSGEQVEYANLLRKVEQCRERISTLLDRKVDLQIQMGWISGNVTLLEKAAREAARPLERFPVGSVVFWGLLAIAGIAGAVYFVEVSDDTFKADFDVTRAAGDVPLLGVVPWAPQEQDRLLWFHPYRSPLREEFSRITAFLLPGQWPKALMVTSWDEGAGKSTVAANLAVAFAHSTYAATLVDLDLYKPVQHLLFDVPSDPGVSMLMREPRPENPVELFETLARRLALPMRAGEMDLIPAGQLEEQSPSGLARDPFFAEFLAGLKSRGDVVLYDTPPLAGSAMALAMASHVDGAILVVEAGVTTRRQLQEAGALLKKVGCPLVGLVLSKSRDSLPGRG